MSDKFRSTFPIAIEFAEGELPTHTKLNAIARQAKQGMSILETAVGDIWNQSGDSLLHSSDVSGNALAIANIGRFLGKAHLVNPLIPWLPAIKRYFYKITGPDVTNGHELVLTFPMLSSGTTFTWTGTTPRPTGSPKTSLGLVITSGDWYINRTTGFVYTYDSIQADWILEYEPVVDGDVETKNFNVIPDPDTDTSYAFQGVKIEFVNGTDSTDGYRIFLPPRGPLNEKINTRSPQLESLNSLNFSTTTTALNTTFFQSDTVAADTGSNAEHYRYILPEILIDADDWAQSVTIPYGSLFLWDSAFSGSVLEGIFFTADDQPTPRNYALVARGTALDSWLGSYGSSTYTTAMMQSASHSATYYPANGLRIITVGTSLAEHAFTLMTQFLNHDHSSSNSMPSRPVPHTALKNTFNHEYLSTPATLPRLNPSVWPFDDHPQYLHRGGSGNRDEFSNGMLGSLLMNSTGSATSYTNITSDSHKIVFGTYPNGHKIYYKTSGNVLAIEGGLSTNVVNLGLYRYGQTTAEINILSNSVLTTFETNNELRITSTNSDISIEAPTSSNIFIGDETTLNALQLGNSTIAITALEGAINYLNSAGSSYTSQLTDIGRTTILANGGIELAAGGIYSPTELSSITQNDLMLKAAGHINLKAGFGVPTDVGYPTAARNINLTTINTGNIKFNTTGTGAGTVQSAMDIQMTVSSKKFKRTLTSRTFIAAMSIVTGVGADGQYISTVDSTNDGTHPEFNLAVNWYSGDGKGSIALVPWTISSAGNLRQFVSKATGAGDPVTATTYRPGNVVGLVDDFPAGLLTQIRFQWETAGTGLRCKVLLSSFGVGDPLITSGTGGTVNSSGTGTFIQTLNISETLSKSLNILKFLFEPTGMFTIGSTWTIYPMVELTMTYENVGKWDE